MNDPNTVVVKKSLKITVSHKVVKTNLSFLQPYFTEIETYYSDNKPNKDKGIVSYYSLNGLLNRLNTYISTNKKFGATSILKGIYNGGTSGQYCTLPAPFLFFDIDVKNEENKPLQDAYKNARVFELLKKIAVLTWRSNSQKGIAGILYVPQLENITKKEITKHLKICNAITTYLSNILKRQGCIVDFDIAQNKFRQVRFLAEQKEPKELNKEPYTFSYELEEIEATAFNGIKQYQFETPKAIQGSIRQQFNNHNPINNVILNCGFSKVNGTNRFKHFNTTSSSSGSIDLNQNIYYNHSSSFSNQKVFDPFSLVLYTQHNNDYKLFLETLKQQGYKVLTPSQNIVSEQLKNLTKPNISNKEIFAACYELGNLPINEKLDLVNENCRNEKDRLVYCFYLKCKNLLINYDVNFEIENYVSEILAQILEITETKKKVILKAETGTGKTTAFLMDFLKHRPNKRCLILAPLTVIVEQSVSDYNNIIGLTGNSQPLAHTQAKTANIVFATYEQGIKHLEHENSFDFIVIDEVHNLFLSNSYKLETITKLTSLLEFKKVIGLTGTPNNIFKDVGYTLVSVTKLNQKPVSIIQRIDNRKATKIVLQHLEKINGKAIFRLNSTQTIKEVQKALIKSKKYKADEILVLHSSRQIKRSTEYRQIINTSSFPQKIKIVLTTGLIDEGINIKQMGFTDVVFIETEFNPQPEPLKQFFARFRNTDNNRKNYHYYRKKKDQTPKYWNEKKDYHQRLEVLTNNKIDDFNSYEDLTNDNNFFYLNRKINKYYLGYEVLTKFYKFFNHYEFNYYLINNFNLSIEIDTSYSQLCVDDSEISQSKKNIKQQIAEQVHVNWGNIETAISRITTDKQLKKNIEDIGQPVPDKTLDLVQNNIKVFESVCRYYYSFLESGENKPLSFITDGVTLMDSRTINRKLKLFQTINLINKPKTKRDLINQKKLKIFLKDIQNQKFLDHSTIMRQWKRQNITNNDSYKNKHLIDLIEQFTLWRYDGNNNKFYLMNSK